MALICKLLGVLVLAMYADLHESSNYLSFETRPASPQDPSLPFRILHLCWRALALPATSK